MLFQKEEQQVMDQNEAATEARRVSLSQQPQSVKRDNDSSKSTKRSATQTPRDKPRDKAGESKGKARDSKARDRREN
jgi:hypothetical protein